MKKDHLKALAQLPLVLEALESLAADSERLRGLLLRASGSAALADHPERPPLVSPGPVVLMTPERQEYIASRKRGGPLPAGQRRAIEQGVMQEIAAQRQAKLVQFEYNGEEDKSVTDEVIAVEELKNLSGAS